MPGSQDKILLRKMASELADYFKTDNCWELKDGAKELIHDLHSAIVCKNNYCNLTGMGIISNFDTRLYQLLEVFRIENIFSPIVLSHEHQVSKPSKEIFNLALSSKEFPGKEKPKPWEALHVGDNYELDYIGAINAGWKGCLIGAQSQKSITDAANGIAFPDLRTFHHFLREKGKRKFFFYLLMNSCGILKSITNVGVEVRVKRKLKCDCCRVAIKVN